MLPEQAAVMAARRAPRYAIFWNIATEPGTRIWTGFGDYQASTDDDIEPDAKYKGAGILTAMDEISQLVGGVAERITMTFSGDAPDLTRFSENRYAGLRDKAVNIGVVFFDSAWQAVAPIGWFYDAKIDQVVPGYDDDVRTLILSCSTGNTDRTKANRAYFTDASQQQRSPGDQFCALVHGYGSAKSVKWPE